jgi:polyisoprenoid-binding protein YceI
MISTNVNGDLPTKQRTGAFVGHWTLDASESTVGLKAKAILGLHVRGTFRDLRGTADVAEDGSVSGRLEIPAASIDTGIRRRDRHLRNDDFFAVDRWPFIVFALDNLAPEGEGDRWLVSGRLTVRDRSMLLRFPATVSLEGDRQVAIDAQVIVDRLQVGLDYGARRAKRIDNLMSVHAVFVLG